MEREHLSLSVGAHSPSARRAGDQRGALSPWQGQAGWAGVGRSHPRGCGDSFVCKGWVGSGAAPRPPAPPTQIRGATLLTQRSRLMSRGTNESVCYLSVSCACRTAPGRFEQTNEGNMSIRACHAPGPAPQAGSWLGSALHPHKQFIQAHNTEDFL